jgi:ABC-2 type transport system ATP-binding protein
MPEVVLQAEGLTKRYGELVAVDHLSLEIHEGEVFGFLGPNGAGKTTSINMMCGLLKPDAGHVLVHGQHIAGGAASVRARVGMCPQEIVVWSHLTCIEQLQFMGEMYGVGGQESRRRGDQLLEDLGLAEKRNKQARTLSGGMKRRLNLALALVHDPDIVALDEPEAGLDPQGRVAVRAYIKQLAARKTVILTTHNMDEADRLADRVAIIDHGRLLVLDTPRALKRSVGEGDVLEIALHGDETSRQQALEALAGMDGETTVTAADESLHVRARNAVSLLPEILESLKAASVPFGEVRVRENTLEDVFIHLTGRRLRE